VYIVSPELSTAASSTTATITSMMMSDGKNAVNSMKFYLISKFSELQNHMHTAVVTP